MYAKYTRHAQRVNGLWPKAPTRWTRSASLVALVVTVTVHLKASQKRLNSVCALNVMAKIFIPTSLASQYAKNAVLAKVV